MILALDPGLDATGWALIEPRRGGVVQQLTGIVDVGVCRTKAREELPDRLAALARAVEDVAQEWHAEPVLIEKPRIAGVYGERRGRQRGKGGINARALQTFGFACGAIIAAARRACPTVILVPASSLPKDQRHDLLRTCLQQAGRDDLTGVRSPDIKDAMWLGATYLGNRS